MKLILSYRGNATAGAIRSFLASEHPDCPKHLFKKVVLKAVEKKMIKQTKVKVWNKTFIFIIGFSIFFYFCFC